MEKQPPTNPHYEAPPPYPGSNESGYPKLEGAGFQQGPPPPHPYPYPQMGMAGPATVVVTQGAPGATTVIIAPLAPGPSPTQMQCPNCRAQVVTEIKSMPGVLTWLVCGGCALFGCWLGCCLIPFCIDDLQDVEHRCPNCKQYIGTYRRL